MREDRFARTELLVGKHAIDILRARTVAVFGVGGVGSYSAEALARSGVGRLVLIDHDLICESNVNRQVHALSSTIGLPKVEVMRNRIMDINPNAVVETKQIFYLPGSEDISWEYDYVIDAVDTMTAKLDIVVEAKKRGIPVISAMGAGNKLDPTRFEIADISETSICPLAKIMRRELKKRGIESLKVVYTKEPPIAAVESRREESNANRPPPGSIAFVPPVMGLIMAGEVVKYLVQLRGSSLPE